MKRFIAILSASVLLCTSSVFAIARLDQVKATETEHVSMWKAERAAAKEEGKERREAIEATWDEFHTDRGTLRDYLAADLDEDEKKTLRMLLKDTQEEAMTVQKDFVKSFTASDEAVAEVEAVVEELADLWYGIHDDIAPYVADGKEGEYE